MKSTPPKLNPTLWLIWGVILIFQPTYAQSSQRVKATVAYATTTEIFFAMGQEQGVIPNQQINLRRGNKVVTTCVLEEISDHQSVCRGTGAKAGDLTEIFILPRQESASPYKTFVFTSMNDNERRKAMIANGLLIKAPYKKKKGVEDTDTMNFEAEVEHQTWYQQESRAGNFSREILDLGAQDISLFGDVKANIDTSTWYWSSRPATARFRTDEEVQFYVWEASAGNRAEDGFAYSVGRSRPGHIPGIVVIDGGTAEYKFSYNNSLGVLAGFLPDLVTTGLSNDSWTIGAFARYQIPIGDNSSFHQQARAGVRHTSDYKSRVEFQTQLGLDLFQRVSLWLDALLGAGGSLDKDLDALRGGIFLRPTQEMTTSFNVRILRNQTNEGYLPAGQSSKHFDGDVQYQLTPRYSVAGLGGKSIQSGGENVSQSYLAPEFRMKDFIWSTCTLTTGYQEDFGWLRGRQIYISPQYMGTKSTRASLRVSAAQNERNSKASKEYGLGGMLHFPMASWLWLKLNSQIQFGDIPLGVFAFLGLDGKI